MSIYRKDSDGNIKKIAGGKLVIRENTKWFMCTRSYDGTNEYYDISEEAYEYYKGFQMNTLYSLGFDEPNTTDRPKLRFNNQSFDITIYGNMGEEIPIGKLNGIFQMYLYYATQTHVVMRLVSQTGVKGDDGSFIYKVISPQWQFFNDGDVIPISLINIPDGIRDPKIGDYIMSFKNAYLGQIMTNVAEENEMPMYELGNVATLKGADAGYYADAEVIDRTINDLDRGVSQWIGCEIEGFDGKKGTQLVLKVNGTLMDNVTYIDINDIMTPACYKGSNDLRDYISSGDICTFIFDGEYWQLISVARKAVKGDAKKYHHFISFKWKDGSSGTNGLAISFINGKSTPYLSATEFASLLLAYIDRSHPKIQANGASDDGVQVYGISGNSNTSIYIFTVSSASPITKDISTVGSFHDVVTPL